MAENDQIKKFIQILVNMAGVEESKKQSEEFYKTHHDGMGQSKRDAEEASPKIEDFLKRWKYELLLVGGAVAGIYALVKYSTVAHTMTDLLGRSFGYLADIILVGLLPVVVVLTSWILSLARGFQDLPKWVRDVIAWGAGLIIMLEAASKAMAILGINAGIAGVILGGLAGMVIGIAVVLTLRELGFFKALGDVIGNAKAGFQNWLDGLQMTWDNFWIDRANFFVRIWNETFGRIPGMQLTELPNLDKYDYYLKELKQQVNNLGGAGGQGGVVGGRTATGSTTEPFADGSQWADIIDDMNRMGMTPEEFVAYMKKNKVPLPTWEFVPPHEGWNEENNPAKDFLSWGYNYQDNKQGKVPSTDLSGLEAKYRALFPNEPSAVVPTQGTSGSTPSTSTKNETPQITIEHADIHLNPTDLQNRALMDQITQIVNRSNSTALRGSNFYG